MTIKIEDYTPLSLETSDGKRMTILYIPSTKKLTVQTSKGFMKASLK